MNKQHTHYLQSCKFFFTLMIVLFFINGNLQASHADLELTMTSPNSNPGVYENVDIEITITNNGPDATNNVVLEFPFPTDLPITGDPVETQGFFSEWWTGTGVWTVGTLAPGQTETVSLTLFTLAEDLFFYGQVVSSSIVDNDSTPDNGTPPNPNEDDEAVVAINDNGGGDCELTVLISNIECDDFNTPNLEYDDIFTFDITVTGQNTSGTWTTVLPSVDAFPPTIVTESYGVTKTVAYNIVQANDAFGGIVNFTVQDSDDSSCSEDVSVIVPPSCSPGSGCNIGGSTSNIQCFDGGTPNNSNDDQWSFDLTVNGSNTGANWMAVINGQTYTGNYNQVTSLGLFPISGGDVFVALMDSSNPACTDGITVNAPAPCSNGGNCSISFMGIESVCDDSGTPNDPTDDVWFAELTPQGSGLGATFSITGDIDAQNLAYGQTYSFGPYPIQPFFERNFIITDDDDSSCFSGFILGPSATCSGGGLLPDLQPITAQAFLNSNQTMLDLSLTYVNGGDAPAGNNVSVVYLSTDNQVSANDIVLENTYAFMGSLGVNQETSFGSTVPVPQVAAGSYFVLFSVDDDNDVAESFEFNNVAGFPITITGNPGDGADLELSMTSNAQTGAFQNISFDLTVTNTGTAAATLVDIFIPQPTDLVLQGSNPYNATDGIINGFNDVLWSFASLAPGQSEVLTINYFTLSDGALTCFAQVSSMGNADVDSTPGNGTPPTPNEDDEAAFTISGENCSINGILVNTVCQDKNTPNDSSDDTWAFVLHVTNSESNSNSYLAQVNGNTFTVAYNENVPFGVFPIADGDITVILTDQFDPDCSETMTIPAPLPCSNNTSCTITPIVNVSNCNDNGTPNDPADDFFSYDVTVLNTGGSSGFNTQAVCDLIPNGSYGTTLESGPVLISDFNNGANTCTISDNNDATCTANVVVFVPDPCSNGSNCNINETLVNTVCQDNNTPNDPSDDTWAFVLHVTNSGSGSNSYLAEVNGNTFTVAYNEDVPFGTFPIADGDITVVLTDQFDPNCTTNVVVFAPNPCSDGGGNLPDLELDVTSNSTYQDWGYMSFEINLTNNGTAPATGVKVQVFEIQGGIYEGGNEGSATAGVFYPTNAGASFWDLNGVTIEPGQTEILTINCFIFNNGGIQTWAQVWEQNETDLDSTPGNGFPFSNIEDDEDSGLLTASGFSLVAQGTNQSEPQWLDTKLLIKSIYPNPAADNLTIDVISTEQGIVTLQISNIQGSLLQLMEQEIEQGYNSFNVEVSTLPRGIYFLKIETEEGMEVKRFLKH